MEASHVVKPRQALRFWTPLTSVAIYKQRSRKRKTSHIGVLRQHKDFRRATHKTSHTYILGHVLERGVQNLWLANLRRIMGPE